MSIQGPPFNNYRSHTKGVFTGPLPTRKALPSTEARLPDAGITVRATDTALEDDQTWNTLMQEGGIEAGLNNDLRLAAARIYKADNRWRHWSGQ